MGNQLLHNTTNKIANFRSKLSISLLSNLFVYTSLNINSHSMKFLVVSRFLSHFEDT